MIPVCSVRLLSLERCSPSSPAHICPLPRFLGELRLRSGLGGHSRDEPVVVTHLICGHGTEPGSQSKPVLATLETAVSETLNHLPARRAYKGLREFKSECKEDVCGSERVQTPYRCHKRNQGLFAYFWSCIRFAASRSASRSCRVSGSANMRSSHSISARVFSMSMLSIIVCQQLRRSADGRVSPTSQQR
jgi:hypothetical protein